MVVLGVPGPLKKAVSIEWLRLGQVSNIFHYPFHCQAFNSLFSRTCMFSWGNL